MLLKFAHFQFGYRISFSHVVCGSFTETIPKQQNLYTSSIDELVLFMRCINQVFNAFSSVQLIHRSKQVGSHLLSYIRLECIRRCFKAIPCLSKSTVDSTSLPVFGGMMTRQLEQRLRFPFFQSLIIFQSFYSVGTDSMVQTERIIGSNCNEMPSVSIFSSPYAMFWNPVWAVRLNRMGLDVRSDLRYSAKAYHLLFSLDGRCFDNQQSVQRCMPSALSCSEIHSFLSIGWVPNIPVTVLLSALCISL